MLTRSLFVLMLVLLSACTTIPPQPQLPPAANPGIFSHDEFDKVLNHYVDDRGLVDYRSLKEAPQDLEEYYQLVGSFSPDSNPELFNTSDEQLAYWLNAYNAAAMTIVLSYYPIASVEDVTPPFPLFFLPDKTGFFYFQRPVFGKVATSLYYLENGVIRQRFSEPRIHFALNCASRGCPRLPRYAFRGEELEQQLEFETRRFFSEERNFRIDREQQTIFLSSIMKWYHDDFIDWYMSRYPGEEAAITGYIALYLPKEKSAELKSVSSGYRLQYVPYDWALNDQNARK